MLTRITLLPIAVTCAITFAATSSQAQTVFLGSQAEVDAATNLVTVDQLEINGFDIVDLTPLSNLTTVNSWLWIRWCDNLANLDGLQGVTYVGGVHVNFNNSLSDIEGLRNVASSGSEVQLYYNPQLANVDGLRGLTTIGGDLYVENNPVLTEFCGLHPLFDNGGATQTVSIAFNAQNPTPAQIEAGGPCATLEWHAASNCDFGRQLTLVGDSRLGGTITATMSGAVGWSLMNWALSSGPFGGSCSHCQVLQAATPWEWASSLSVSVPNDTNLIGLEVMTQGVDLSLTTGEVCFPFVGNWAFTDIHVATIGA